MSGKCEHGLTTKECLVCASAKYPAAQQQAQETSLPLTEEQIGKHTLLAGDCPPASEVLLVSSVRRLQAKTVAQTSLPPQGVSSLPPSNALPWETIRALALEAGFNLDPTPNMLYTVRGNSAQLINFARLLAASPAPAPQEPAEPMDWPLPCDVTVGNGTHRKGTSLGTLVARMRMLHREAFGDPPSPEEAARNLAELQGYASPATGELGAVDASEGWISVDDRMPEPDSGEVLVWLSGGRCAFDEWHMHREDPTGMSTTYTMEMGLMWRDYEFEDITHWMPLPQPPQQAPSESST